jgi:hypothetical protein
MMMMTLVSNTKGQGLEDSLAEWPPVWKKEAEVGKGTFRIDEAMVGSKGNLYDADLEGIKNILLLLPGILALLMKEEPWQNFGWKRGTKWMKVTKALNG